MSLEFTPAEREKIAAAIVGQGLTLAALSLDADTQPEAVADAVDGSVAVYVTVRVPLDRINLIGAWMRAHRVL